MAFQKNDFVEIEFTGRVDGNVFDSNIKEDLKTLNPEANPSPLIFCLGEGMFLRGIDDFLIGKEPGKYHVELSPDKAFGPRIPEFIQKIPIKVFHGQNVRPVPGAVFNFDGRVAKILTVSGGRVTADFNNPLAGKNVSYDVNVLRKVEDINEKIRAMMLFLFRREFKFAISDKKLIIEVPKEMAKFVEMFSEKFKEIFGLEVEVKEAAGTKENSQKTEQ